jgi:UDP-N-acetylglucosamine:LPS N-acetylglucosamine transferase
VLGGAHTALPGAFDFERDGLGPVVDDAEAVVDALAGALGGVSSVAPDRYAERRARAAAFADGHSAARIILQIEDLLS